MDFLETIKKDGKIPIIPSERKTSFGVRYKMATLEIKNETNFTRLLNIEEVGKDLERDPDLILKFFGVELGCQSMIKRGEYFLAGEYKASQLQELLDKFILGYILCVHCNNPETKFKTTGKKKVEKVCLECAACGNRTTIDIAQKKSLFLLRYFKALKSKYKPED